jgi:hypothetical protein
VDNKTEIEEPNEALIAAERKRKMKMYPALALVYEVYINDRVEEMGADILGYIDELYKPDELHEHAKRLKVMMQGIAEGTSPNEEVIAEACEMIEEELNESPIPW